MKKNKKQSIKNSRKNRFHQNKALEKRIKTSQQKSKGYRSNIFKPGMEFDQWFPKDGSHIIDIIPYYAGKNDPATEEDQATYTFEYQYHRVGPNNIEFVCPRMYGKKCPVCEHRDKLREKDDDNYKDYWPKVRNLYNVICYDDKQQKKKGVQVWDVANFYFEKPLMAISRKPSLSGEEEKTINFIDPIDGKSVTFTVEPAKGKEDFPKYVGHSFDDRDYEIDDDILDAAHKLDELVYIASYDEIKKAMNADDEEEETETEENETTNELLLDELEDCEDMEDLIEFAEEHDLEVDEDGKFKKEKKKLREQLLEEEKEKSKKKKSKSKNDDEDDEDEDEDEEVEEEKDDDDDDDDDDDEVELPTKKEIKKMKYKELKALVKEHDLDIDMDDYTKKDTKELQDDIIEEMDL